MNKKKNKKKDFQIINLNRQGYIEYSSNNSGGVWWLSDEDWYNLEYAGWIIKWATLKYNYNDKGNYI